MVTLLLPTSSSSIFKASNFIRFQMNSQLRNSASSPKKYNPKEKSNFNSKKRFSKYGTSRKSVIKKSFSQEQVNFNTPLPVDPTVAIIGGGISGLICALTLEERNIRSTVFDTGMHGLGGRLGTRKIDFNSQELLFDHAAQFFTVDDSRFEKFVTKWLDEGLILEWKGQLGELDVAGQFNPLPYTTKRYIGRMGMRPLADSILQQSNRVEVVRPCWVSKLEPFNGMWHLSENGEPRGQFDSIVIAHNGKCANRLLSSSGLPLLYKQMKSLELSSIWALLAAFKDPLPIPNGSLASFEGAFVKGVDSLSWMADNTTKLSLLDSGAPHCWTFFSTAAYGKKNKVPQENIPKATAEKVKADMLEGVEIALGLSKGSLQQPVYSRVQLWGAALPANAPGVPCIFDPKGRAGICGDWLLGSSIEAVVISGISLGNHVKDVLFGPVRKTQDAMFFIKIADDMLMSCGPKQPGAVQTTMEEFALKGLASKILPPPISRTDFDKVLARQRPTVSKGDLEVHERFTKEFGEQIFTATKTNCCSRSLLLAHRKLLWSANIFFNWRAVLKSSRAVLEFFFSV